MKNKTLLSLLTATLLLSAYNEEKQTPKSEAPQAVAIATETNSSFNSEEEAKTAIRKVAEEMQEASANLTQKARELAHDAKDDILRTIEESNSTKAKEMIDKAVVAIKDALSSAEDKLSKSLEDVNTTKAAEMIERAKDATKKFMSGTKDMLHRATAPDKASTEE